MTRTVRHLLDIVYTLLTFGMKWIIFLFLKLCGLLFYLLKNIKTTLQAGGTSFVPPTSNI